MTNKKFWMGILAIMLVFGMTVVGCEDEPTDNNDGQETDVVFTSIQEFAAWLAAQPDNDATTAYTVKLNVSDLGSGYGGNAWKALHDNETKYVSLDLSGNTFTSIGESVFEECKNLTSITIPNSIISIGKSAFCASGLTSVIIPASVTSIGKSAFAGTKITNVNIPSGITSIEENVFGYTSLASVTIPATITSIGNYAFSSCTNLISVKFEGTITSANFSSTSSFGGDLRTKFYATDSANGTAGTYTTTAPVGSSSVWTKQ